MEGAWFKVGDKTKGLAAVSSFLPKAAYKWKWSIPKSFVVVVQSLSLFRLFVTPWTAGFPALHQLLELAQTFVHWISHAIQPSQPLSSPSPTAFNLSLQQGIFQWVLSAHKVAKVLEFQLQHQFFQWTSMTDFLLDWLIWSPCSPRDSQESSPTPQFKSSNSSVLSFLYSPTLTSICDY